MSDIWFDEDGILWMEPNPGCELDLQEVEACFSFYRKMGINKNNKVLQIIDGRMNVSMNKEGRDYVAEHGSEFFLASAIISNSLSIRLIVNFFNYFYKTKHVPFKMFDSEAEARKWLMKFKDIG